MDLHVVRPGDTLYGIAREYGVSMDRLLQDNQLPDPSQLVVGQVILVRYPALTHVVKEGDTLWSVARSYQVGPDQLLRNNPGLRGLDRIFPGQALVIRYQGEPQGALTVNAYAYPSIDGRCSPPPSPICPSSPPSPSSSPPTGRCSPRRTGP